MTDTDDTRELNRIAGDLHEWLSNEIHTSPGDLYLGEGEFTSLAPEEAPELGYEDDAPVILLRRESDGRVFAVEIEVTVHGPLAAQAAGTETRNAE
jgi:hypothetical protein